MARLSRSEIEFELRTIWRELLGFDEFDSDESFFNLGGDSIGIVVMRDSIARRLGTTVSAASLLDLPTIRHIANHVHALQEGAAVPSSSADGERHDATAVGPVRRPSSPAQ